MSGRHMTGLGASILGWVSVLSAGVALVAGFWDGSPWYAGAPEFIGVPLLLGGRYPD
jgi:hypothetical protein